MPKHKYTIDNPQPPCSPLLAEYMDRENIYEKMPVEDARKWFEGLRETLAVHSLKREKNLYGR